MSLNRSKDLDARTHVQANFVPTARRRPDLRSVTGNPSRVEISTLIGFSQGRPIRIRFHQIYGQHALLREERARPAREIRLSAAVGWQDRVTALQYAPVHEANQVHYAPVSCRLA